MNTQELLNKVLRGLRQDVITNSSTTDTYELLLLQYLNEAKEEVEEAWCWQALRTTVTVTLAAGTAEYTLTSAGDADTDTNDRSRLLYEKGFNGSESYSRGHGSQPCVWDVTDSGEFRVKEISWEKMERLHFSDDNEQQDPQYVAFLNDGTNLKMKVWPLPADARTYKCRIFIPQAELGDTLLDTTNLTVPDRPVWTLALWKANAERGEEIAMPGGFNEMAYRQALSAAIAREQSMSDITSYPM